MSSEKVLIGIVAGLAAGTALGILLAPDVGTNTRNKISKIGEEYWGILKTKFEDFALKAISEMEYVKSETENLVDKGIAKVDGVKDEIRYNVGEKISSQS